MVVAFCHPHNEGLVAGIITGPGFDTDTLLVDTFEVDAQIKSFETQAEAEKWLQDEHDLDLSPMQPVAGGMQMKVDY